MPTAPGSAGPTSGTYLDRESVGRGTGTRLYSATLALLRLQNYRVALGCITVPNKASIALHTRFGFRQSALFERAGYKNGKWHDVVWLSLDLCDDDAAPKAIVPVQSLNGDEVARILKEASD